MSKTHSTECMKKQQNKGKDNKSRKQVEDSETVQQYDLTNVLKTKALSRMQTLQRPGT